ncbi:TPA: hypothetical protein R1886_005607 [Klebsiella oxytoca]|nr:hypothetical protein [Klebsiella oxytoca]
MDPKTPIKYLRMMKSDDEHRPLVIVGERDCLTVRTGVEGKIEQGQIVDVVLNEDGHFIHLAQGLSLTVPPKENIPEHLFKPARKLVCFTIASGILEENEHLMFYKDSETHAMIVPKHDMHIKDYQRHLEETKPLWEVLNDEDQL